MTRLAAIGPEPAGRLLDGLGVQLDPESLVLALTHRSFAHEAGGIPTNERLEFLGDSILGLIVTEYLYRAHPELSEGDLAKMRAATVSQRALARVARGMRIGPYILLGRGEAATGGADKDSILSDTLEALLGAVYLAHGLDATREVVLRLTGPTLDRAANLGAGLDWKTSLQELVADMGLGPVEYQSESTGPDHARVFQAAVWIDGLERGQGRGSSKKLAEQRAAADAYERLQDGEPLVELDGPAPGEPGEPADESPIGLI